MKLREEHTIRLSPQEEILAAFEWPDWRAYAIADGGLGIQYNIEAIKKSISRAGRRPGRNDRIDTPENPPPTRMWAPSGIIHLRCGTHRADKGACGKWRASVRGEHSFMVMVREGIPHCGKCAMLWIKDNLDKMEVP